VWQAIVPTILSLRTRKKSTQGLGAISGSAPYLHTRHGCSCSRNARRPRAGSYNKNAIPVIHRRPAGRRGFCQHAVTLFASAEIFCPIDVKPYSRK